ncbi:MAG: class I SAM-dependent methyltransferase [Alphaproteobacteria bacterium]|nr:class I SAM-dependent methyltransferase [Alphaproteobacteria bacterium]
MILAFCAVVRRPDLVGSPQTLSAVAMVVLLGTAWICQGVLLPTASVDTRDRGLMILAIAMRLAAVPWMPHLSDDVYRFLWDGRLLSAGLDPFAHTPVEVWNAADVGLREVLADLYAHLNSPEYYSVYPPLLQGLFAFATALVPGVLLGQVVVLKLVIVAADVASILLLDHLAVRFGVDRRVTWLYALSPVVVVELVGNVHFEALMITGLLGTCALLARGRPAAAGGAFAVAVGAKLLPLIVLPAVLRRLAWRDALVLTSVVVALTVASFAALLDGHDLAHLASSLRLYVRTFAWNGGLYELVQSLRWSRHTGTVLAAVAGGIVLVQAATERAPTVATLPRRMLLALATWHLCATTVHPWYLVPLVALTVLTPYRFAVAWSGLSMLTYAGYWREPVGQAWGVVAVEYVAVAGLLGLEAFVHGSGGLDRWLRRQPRVRRWMAATIPARLARKLYLVTPWLRPDDRVLDLGTGSGAVCAALRELGHDVVAVDLEDHTLRSVGVRIADGTALPFPDDAFDVVLLLTVLHHADDPDRMLGEAARVARRAVVVMEDVHHHPLQRWWTTLADSLSTLDLAGHPHHNRDDAGWRAAFARHGLRVAADRHVRTLGVFAQAVYALVPDGPADRTDPLPRPPSLTNASAG